MSQRIVDDNLSNRASLVSSVSEFDELRVVKELTDQVEPIPSEEKDGGE